MKILQVNKYHYPRGGADKYYLELGELLKANGHQVAFFAMQHPNNLESIWSKYFVSRVSFNENIWRYAYKIPARILYSLEAKRKFKKLIIDFKPEIIHIHNIYHQISPSILIVAKKFNIPVVMHVHDYNLVCPNHSLFTKGKVCTRCLKGNYFNCIQKKCIKDSFWSSLLGVIEFYIHNNILKIYKNNIDLLITPSKFMEEILIQAKWSSKKIITINNPFKITRVKKIFIKKDYFIYCGRLSKEKGIDTLIRLTSKDKNINLKIIGSGPEEGNLKVLVQRLDISKQVSFLGWKKGEELENFIGEAKALLIPSRWLENFPLIALESLALGTPIIASRIGGLPEIVTTENGVLAEADNVDDWLAKVMTIYSNPLLYKTENIINSAKRYSPENNVREVINSYKKLLT